MSDAGDFSPDSPDAPLAVQALHAWLIGEMQFAFDLRTCTYRHRRTRLCVSGEAMVSWATIAAGDDEVARVLLADMRNFIVDQVEHAAAWALGPQ